MASSASSGRSNSSELEQYLVTYMDGAVELLALQRARSHLPFPLCEGQALVITKSSLATPNGGCSLSDLPTLSCTCVAPARADEWVFRLRERPMVPVAEVVPATVNASATVFNVTSLGRFMVPSQVKTLRLLGESETGEPLRLSFDLDSSIVNDGQLSLVQSETEDVITDVEIANIDLSRIIITGSFVPASVKHLTTRNCNISMAPSVSLFSNRWTNLTSLDVSGNKLTGWYDDQPINARNLTMESLNLANNLFTSIPLALGMMDRLTKLNFSNNPVSSLSISGTLFDKIRRLEEFTIDGINTSSASKARCGDGSSAETAHNVTFCVTRPSNSHTVSTKALIIVAIGGTLVILVLAAAVIILQKKRRRESLEKLSHTQELASPPRIYASVGSDEEDIPLSPTLTQAAHRTIEKSKLLDDFLITKNRIDRKDLHIGRVLKRGGYGTVYSGFYKRRRVAIKKLHREHSCDVKLIESFLKEIALMASLSHPRIVEYIGCAWSTIEHLAMVTELMVRGDLREVLQYFKQTNTPLKWTDRKLCIALHIAEALHYLHTLTPKVIHRDLKSKNVLINQDLDAKLTDFGISREGRFEQTVMTANIGTSFWIAPEVLAGLRYDERADIFSFGVVLSEIDTDDYPYCNNQAEDPNGLRGDEEENTILRKVVAGEMRPQFSRECPPFIRELAGDCLQGDPSRRPSASDIVDYLKPLVEAPADLRSQLLGLGDD